MLASTGFAASKMSVWMAKPNTSSRLRKGQEYSKVNFYKAIYAIRCRTDHDSQTKGIACAVYIIDGQNTTDSAPGGGLPYETDGDARRKF